MWAANRLEKLVFYRDLPSEAVSKNALVNHFFLPWLIAFVVVGGSLVETVSSTTTDSAFCTGSKLAFVPILEPGHGFRDKSIEAFCRCPDPAVRHQLVKCCVIPHPGWLMQEVTQERTDLSWFWPRGRMSSKGVRVHCTILHRGCL